MELEKELSKIQIIQEIDDLKIEVDELRPFSDEAQSRFMQKFRLDWNYHSNAIEGNPYTYGETVAFLMHGITAKGKKLKDHLDIKGHDETIKYLLEMVKGERNFTENDIRELHKMILKEPYSNPAITPTGQKVQKEIKLGEYKDMPNHVRTKTGEMHFYATPEETPLIMADLMKWYSKAFENEEIHPLVLASLFHHKFVAIHPFDDGNGRLGRILMNFILMRKSFPPIVVRQEDRDNYYSVLSQADVGEELPLVEYLGEELRRSLDIQLRGAKGEDISEKSDLDKEIALLKGQFNSPKTELITRTIDNTETALRKSIVPTLNYFYMKFREFGGLFFDSSVVIEVHDGESNRIFTTFEAGVKFLEQNVFDLNLWKILVIFNLSEFLRRQPKFDVSLYLEITFGKYNFFINKDDSEKKMRLENSYGEIVSEEKMKLFVHNIIKKFIIEEVKNNTKD